MQEITAGSISLLLLVVPIREQCRGKPLARNLASGPRLKNRNFLERSKKLCEGELLMPIAPKKPCGYPGCPALVDSNVPRCEQHKRVTTKHYDATRGSSTKRGYDSRWQKARATFLRQNSLCVDCKANGLIKEATEVDHEIPHKGNQQLFWDTSNWRARCKSCHSIKTARTDGGFGRNVSKG